MDIATFKKAEELLNGINRYTQKIDLYKKFDKECRSTGYSVNMVSMSILLKGDSVRQHFDIRAEFASEMFTMAIRYYESERDRLQKEFKALSTGRGDGLINKQDALDVLDNALGSSRENPGLDWYAFIRNELSEF